MLAYVFEGAARFGARHAAPVANRHLAVFDDGDALSIAAGEAPARMLLISGRPLREPVAWRGPIVMNTDDELRKAFDELRAGTFVKMR